MKKPDAASHVVKTLKAEQTRLLRDKVTKYRQQRDVVSVVLQRDPERPTRERQDDYEHVAEEVQKLAEMWGEVLPYVRKIKSFVDDVLAENRLSACYRLFGKVSQGMEAIFVLAKGGFHNEVMEIVRSNREALDLASLFLRESDDSALVRKWFDGEIVENAEARNAADRFVKETANKVGITVSLKGIMTGLYRAVSHYSHVSYSALIDAYDVHHDDFDFGRFAGYHYLRRSSLPYVRNEIHSAIIALKLFYQTAGDRDSYVALDTLLRKYAP